MMQKKSHMKNKTFPNYALMKISAWHKQNGDNIGAGSVMQFYFLLQAFETIGKQMRKDMELTGLEDWKEVVNSLTDILKTDLLEVGNNQGTRTNAARKD